MSLTQAQDQKIKIEIDADQALLDLIAAGELQAVADALAEPDVPEFLVWRTNTPAQDIYEAIDWGRYTPADDPVKPGVEATPTADEVAKAHIQNNRAAHLRLKQENLQTMLLLQDSINTSLPGIRRTIFDSCTKLSAGANGALVNSAGAGASTVLSVCRRPANRAERVLALGSQASDTTGTTTARVMGFEGRLTSNDIDRIRNLP